MKKLLVATMIVSALAAAPAFAFDTVHVAQGIVDRVDPGSHTLTMVGGETLRIPSNLSTAWLAPGEEVTVAYRDGKDGGREMTAFWIDSGASGNTRS